MFQQQQLVAIDNCRTLITNLLRHMASSSSSSSSTAVEPVVIQRNDADMTLCHNDAAMLSQSVCNQTSSSSQRHTDSTAPCPPSMAVINDVMSMTSEDNYSGFVNDVVAFVKVPSVCLSVCLYNSVINSCSSPD